MSSTVSGISWCPSIVPEQAWVAEQLKKYLQGQRFTLYSHGSCVVWVEPGELTDQLAGRRLTLVTQGAPDFAVQRHADGNYLVTFKGGIGGVMPGELLSNNVSVLREEAMAFGLLPSEAFEVDMRSEDGDYDLIAGLYVRARLHRDAEDLQVVKVVR